MSAPKSRENQQPGTPNGDSSTTGQPSAPVVAGRQGEQDRQRGLPRESVRADRNQRGWWLFALIVFALALALRGLHFSQARHSPLMSGDLPMYDSRYYDLMARRIAGGDIVGDEVFYLAPMYYYSMAPIYRLMDQAQPGEGAAAAGGGNGASGDASDPSASEADEPEEFDAAGSLRVIGGRRAADPHARAIMAVRLVQLVFGSLTCVLIFAIATRLFDRWIGLVAGLLAAGYGLFMYYDGLVMPTSQVLFLHMLALWLMVIALDRRRAGWWLASGAALGLSAVAHGTALLLIAVLAGWIVVGRFGVPSPWPIRRRLLAAVMLVAGATPVVGAIAVRNYIVGHDLVLLTSNAGKNLWIGNNPEASGSWVSLVSDDVWGADLSFYMRNDKKRTAADLTPSQSSAYFSHKALDWMKSNPGQAVRHLVYKALLFWDAVEIGIKDQFYFASKYSAVLRNTPLRFGLLVPIGLVGFVSAVWQRKRVGVLAVMVLTQFVVFVPFFILARYRVVAVACLLMMAAAQLVWWGQWLRAREWRRVIVSLALLVPVGVFVHWSRGMTPTRGFGGQHLYVARECLLRGQKQEATRHLEEALKYDYQPWRDDAYNQAKCHLALGKLALERGDVEEAIEHFRAGVNLVDEIEEDSWPAVKLRRQLGAAFRVAQRLRPS